MSLTRKIVTAMLLGMLVGVMLNILFSSSLISQPSIEWLHTNLVFGLFDTVGQIFVRSLKLLVVPLVLVSLICGVSSLGNNSRMGAVALKTVVLYLVTTAIAISLAILTAVIVQPGVGIDLALASEFVAKEAPPLKQTLINIFPSNPVESMANGATLQIIVFALLFGFAVTKAGEQGQRIISFFNDLNAVIMKMVMMLMLIAPFGIFCLLAKLFADVGVGMIMSLGKYFLTVLFVLLLHSLGVYSLLLKFFTGLSVKTFLSKLRPALALAFSTASSGATMPVTMRTVEQRLGVSKSVSSFTVPLGATINMDGTAIMQGVATVFIAQAYNIGLTFEGYLAVVLTATLASIGTAAVPGVGLVMLVMVLNQVGLPVEGIGLIIGVDRLLDMTRTATNVTGDAMVTTVVASSEGLVDKTVFDSQLKAVTEDS
ncbi:dicarboxylate/amino acid:cation symporter [Porticoccaceae bacterium]|jgi:Na+/H+-dicarboxylate symporter|nr:dicarboxylate/amino acid:cation symporter [Porticoccaceae bacterium]MDA8898454.1 dicarboxylate/amino acid:cation symporter [Porticoccaceae bacterium]MDB3925527.1 dicarboxylate/amino acid:cation symporter [Porticoccaceae bacterium]